MARSKQPHFEFVERHSIGKANALTLTGTSVDDGSAGRSGSRCNRSQRGWGAMGWWGALMLALMIGLRRASARPQAVPT